MNNKVKKPRIEIVGDLETWGKDGDTALIQIAAVAFDIDTGEYLSEFNELCDISKSKILVDGSTLKWWLNTDKELLTRLVNSGKDDEETVVRHFYDWIVALKSEYEVYFWGNGILFDNKIIQAKMAQYGLQYPIFYRNDRDLRTIVDIAESKFGVNVHEVCASPDQEKHNAIDDVKHEIDVLCWCWKALHAE